LSLSIDRSARIVFDVARVLGGSAWVNPVKKAKTAGMGLKSEVDKSFEAEAPAKSLKIIGFSNERYIRQISLWCGSNKTVAQNELWQVLIVAYCG